MKISVIIPIYNEAGSIPDLFLQLKSTLGSLGHEYEILAIDDGSRDESPEVLRKAAKEDSHIKVIRLQHNYGQTAALSAGISHASGEVIVPIDADLENRPEDIPLLLAELKKGYDIVSGWRVSRWQGQWITRKLPSLLANKLISWITGLPLHDYGCTLKAYTRESVQDIPLYGEMHRFIPAYAAWNGYKVTEIPVQYRPRKFGKSNYGISRTFRVLLDLVLLKFLSRYMSRPMHFFGGIGFSTLAIGIFAGAIALFLRLAYNIHMIQTPLPVFSALFVIVGVQLIVMGVLAEMIMRTYYESQHKTTYRIKETINF